MADHRRDIFHAVVEGGMVTPAVLRMLHAHAQLGHWGDPDDDETTPPEEKAAGAAMGWAERMQGVVLPPPPPRPR